MWPLYCKNTLKQECYHYPNPNTLMESKLCSEFRIKHAGSNLLFNEFMKHFSLPITPYKVLYA